MPKQKIHVAGVCGVFMAGIARLAKEMGCEVVGSDLSFYQPMNGQLQSAGIKVKQGYDKRNLDPHSDLLIVGNALSRGTPLIEEALTTQLPFMSGPQWLAARALKGRTTAAVAGTHGKTTTASMIAWILQYCGTEPGFLIGGVPKNFGVSAQLGKGKHFVVEADEYDSAFFDKRPKFMHFYPQVLVLNNLEYDHADIYPDLAALELQFSYLLRNVPAPGVVIARASDKALKRVIAKGVWSRLFTFGYGDEQADWTAQDAERGGCQERQFAYDGKVYASELKNICGKHNVMNATAALAAAYHLGVAPPKALAALERFSGVARRLEVVAKYQGITICDDFAHHPTAIAASINAVRSTNPKGRVLAIFEPRSNTMKTGTHKDTIIAAFSEASKVYCYCPPELDWPLEKMLVTQGDKFCCFRDTKTLMREVTKEAREHDFALIMSNGSFENLPARLAAYYSSQH